MEIDKELYKDIEIEVRYNKDTKCFHADTKVGSSHNDYDTELKNFCHGHKTPQEAIENAKAIIDEFFSITPKTYKELAEAITNSLVWTGYEECYADENIIKQLVSSFNKIKDNG